VLPKSGPVPAPQPPLILADAAGGSTAGSAVGRGPVQRLDIGVPSSSRLGSSQPKGPVGSLTLSGSRWGRSGLVFWIRFRPRARDEVFLNLRDITALNGIDPEKPDNISRGSGSGFLVISGGLVSSKNRGVGRVSPDGTYRSASVGDDGVALTATGRMSGNTGSGSYRRADGCNGRWTARRR
jgi:hypothetical protein